MLVLFKRFPKLSRYPKPHEAWARDSSLVSDEHPALADDLRVWTERVEVRFRVLDHTAIIEQNRFRRQHVALIFGGLLATTLGAVQAAAGGGVLPLAVAQALLTGLLAGLTVVVRSRRAQQGYLTARLKAERIKSEFFLFLARAGDYGGPDAQAKFIDQVEDIEAAEGSA
jgi:hypothetical protein